MVLESVLMSFFYKWLTKGFEFLSSPVAILSCMGEFKLTFSLQKKVGPGILLPARR